LQPFSYFPFSVHNQVYQRNRGHLILIPQSIIYHTY
jgi:hypothetical protein